MTYTLWSRGRLLGESPLDFVRCLPKLRVGFLHPTPLGDKLLPVAAGVTPASLAFGKVSQALESDCPEEDWHRLPEYADYRSACDEEAALQLELRGPDGKVIPTEDIAVRDTEFLIALGDEAARSDPETRAVPLDTTTVRVDEDDVLPWDSSDDELDVDALVAEFEALAADDAADAHWRPREERPWMRYQLQVTLDCEWSIP